MKIRKISMTLLLVGLMIGGSAVAISGQISTKTYLGLTDIYNRIEEDNLEVALSNDEIELAYENLEVAKDEQYEYVSGDDVDRALVRTYNPIEEEMDYNHAIIDRDELIEDLQTEATRLYYEHILMREELELKQKEIDVLNEDKEQVQEEIRLGLKTSSDEISIDKDIAAAEFNYNQLVLENRKIEMDMNILINNDISDELYITSDPIPEIEFVVEDIEADIKNAYILDTSLEKMVEEIAVLKEKRAIYKDYRDDYESTYDGIQADIDVLSINMVQAYADIEYDVRSTYNTILNYEADMDIATLNIANLNIDLDEAQTKYELGLVTIDTVEDIEDTIELEEFELKTLKLEYYLSVEDYNKKVR